MKREDSFHYRIISISSCHHIASHSLPSPRFAQGVCADLAAAKDGLAKGEALKAELEDAQVKIYAERDELSATLNAEREAGGDMEAKYQEALKAKAAAEEQLKEVRLY